MLLRRLNVFDSQSQSEAYSLEEILHATNNFSDENVIMEGAAGKVYKVKLLNLTNLAVRRFDCMYGQGDELQTEISMIRRLQNKNIASVRGVCDDNNEQIIVYEQAFHGTLDQHLSDPTLTWPQRLQICLGVAHGLNHIHYDIIHCDINSSKIFLDEDWEPKIYGFELSSEYPQTWVHRLRFSHHFGTNNMTPKYDVYCFGVLLLQVVCGTKRVVTDGASQAELDKINDHNSWKQMDMQSLSQFKGLADKCLNQHPDQRPNMDQIVKELEDMLLELQWRCEMKHPTAADENNSKMDILKIPLSEIKQVTDDFNEDYVVGRGAYGIVYKANLDIVDIQNLSSMEEKHKNKLPKINKTVAIKRIINREDKQDKQGFLTEIESLTRCRHRNIISLLGFSREAGEMIIVYEYAFKGSLNDYLGSTRVVNLPWVQRIQICLDIANGINYIHTKIDGKPRIIHRDIKSDNILLDENLNAKIADFGLSKFHDMKQQASTIYSKNIAGTPFYMDPEYLTTGKYKRESDTYSFGVVLFEVLSGKLAYDSIYINGEKEVGIAPVARRRFNEGTLKELIDPKIIEQDEDDILILNRGPNQESFDAFSKIAYQCLAETQAKRPTMEVVIKELQNALNKQGKTMVLSRFRLNDIVLATKGFAKTNCIGFDTNGVVYKAELDHFGNTSNSLATEGKNNGEPSKKRITVAIKQITGRKHAFIAELEMRTIYKHPNIVSPLGFCDEGGKMIIVYEHASKRSLRYCLSSINGMNILTWTQRLRMCLEIARGLDHLHTKMGNHHGDINSANILLGKNWEAKIAYFGISEPNSNQDDDMEVYRDPEVGMTWELGRKSDIYSFGVVLFEIFCGRLAYDSVYMAKNDKGLAPIARQCFNDGTIETIIDPSLNEETDEDILASNGAPNQDSVNKFLKIAYQCLEEADERPTMGIMIKELDISLNFQEALKKKLQISLKNIESGTENFSEKNCVASGRFWKAYKVLLQDINTNTTLVAKRWDHKFGEGDYQFRTEVNILFKHKHENVIGLVGYCNEMEEKIIIYEHMSKGSLDKYLKDDTLTWTKRLKICIDVAKGLNFLHQGGGKLKKVIHSDVKSSSILLNDDWKAKVCNLEMSSVDSLHMVNPHATFGYLDPHHRLGYLTEKSDIYSFGVVLFEILCGRLAWGDDCMDHFESLGPLAKRFYEEGKLDEMVFEGIKEQINMHSLNPFADIAYQCLHDEREERPTASHVLSKLNDALYFQKKHEEGVETPELNSISSRGILIHEGKVWYSHGSTGVINEMVSATQFSYGNHSSHNWRYIQESRFGEVAEMSDISNLNIEIKIRSKFLSPGVHYGVHLVFKFSTADTTKSIAKQQMMYVNLTYEMGGQNQTLHAYFATWRDDDWMTIELHRFLNYTESDTRDFEFLIKSFSQCYCENLTVYIEGLEFRPIENASFTRTEENSCLTDVQHAINIDPIQQLQTNDIRTIKTLKKLFTRGDHRLSANATLCNAFNIAKLYYMKPSSESRYHKVAELLSTQQFRIKFKIESKMLSENTYYGCYLVFQLSESERGLHCPVMVQDLNQRKNKQTEVVYFRSPSPSNIHDFSRLPRERKDGWMELCVWKFKSDHDKLRNNCVSMNLKFTSYEGTMSGLIICDVELHHM